MQSVLGTAKCSQERDQTQCHPVTTTNAAGISIGQGGSSSASPAEASTNVSFVPIGVSALSLDLVIWKGLAHHRKLLNSCFPAAEHPQEGFSLLPCLREGFKWPCELHAVFPWQCPPDSNHRHSSASSVPRLSLSLPSPGSAFQLQPGDRCHSSSSSCALWSEWDCVLSAK